MLCLHQFKLVCLGGLVWSSRRGMRLSFHSKSCWQVRENTYYLRPTRHVTTVFVFFFSHTKSQCISTNNYTFPMRPDCMWIWILHCIFVYRKLQQVKRFEKTHTYIYEVNSKTKKGIHATHATHSKQEKLENYDCCFCRIFVTVVWEKPLKIIHSKSRTLWFDLVSEIFWHSCRKNTSATNTMVLHHLSFKPSFFLVLSSHNPLAMGKCISLTFPCTEHVFEFYNTLLISWNFRRPLDFMPQLCGYKAGGEVITPLYFHSSIWYWLVHVSSSTAGYTAWSCLRIQRLVLCNSCRPR